MPDANAGVAAASGSALGPTITPVVAHAGVATASATVLSGSAGWTPTVDLVDPPLGRRWRVLVTNVDGVVYAELENAVLSGIDYELNRAETWTFTLPQNDPKCAFLLDVPFREVQVWRGNRLLAWGPAVRTQIDNGFLTVACSGALWHLGRRHIGKADRYNWVVNGDFEQGLTGWDFFYNEVLVSYGAPHAQPHPPAAAIVNFPTVTGSLAMRLENAVNGADAWVGQSFRFTVDDANAPEGETWTMKGYVYVEDLDEGAAAFQGRGLYLERFSTTELNPDPLVQAVLPGALLSLQHEFADLDEELPKNVWIRQEVEFTTPPKAGEPEEVAVRLYAPNGVVYWDAVSLTRIERLAFYGVDQSQIAEGIVQHLQDADYDKSDVNIGTHCPPSGVRRTRVYVHSEHPNGLGALEEFNGLDTGFDFNVEYTATTRTFRTYYPQKGALRSGYALDAETNLASWNWTFDGEQASTSVIALGSGNGSDREEGFAIDTSTFEGGLTLEEVFPAAPEATIDSLDNLAAERLIIARNPVVLEVKTVTQAAAVDPVGVLAVGDLVPVTIQRNDLDIDDVYRIVRMTINPDHTLDLTLNLRSDGAIDYGGGS